MKVQGKMDEIGDKLFVHERLALDGTERGTVVVVGLPRSGSSFLSHVLSQLPGWYVFDDLYLSREARRIRATGELDDTQLKKLLDFLGWQIWARKRYGTYAVPNITEDEIEPMKEALFATFSGLSIDWMALQEEWLIRLGSRSDASNWGYKMPGAFRHLDTLLNRHPGMKVVFLMRGPEKVLASYKHLPEESEDGDAGQYHPVAHAYYWRMAARAWLDAKKRWPDQVMLLRFEDLVSDPTVAGRSLAAHLGAVSPDEITTPPRPNSSFTGPAMRPELTRLEQWIIARTTSKERKALGFAPMDHTATKAGVSDFLWITVRFICYQVHRFVQKFLGKN